MLYGGSDQWEEDREDEQTVEESEDDNTRKHLEEGQEHVWVAEGHQTEGQESGEPAIEDGGAHQVEGLLGSLLPVALLGDDVGHADVGGVVQGQTHREYQYDGGGDLYRQSHEVSSAGNLQQSQGHAEEHEDADHEVGDQEEIDDGNRSKGKANVPQELRRYDLVEIFTNDKCIPLCDLVRLPLYVHHSVRYWTVEVRSLELDLHHGSFHRVHGPVPDGGVLQSLVLECSSTGLSESEYL